MCPRPATCLTILLAVSTTALFAQNPVATITGQVKDSSGAAIAGAKVTAHNLDTNFERSALTSEGADYTLPLLPIGRYEVRVEMAGFRSELQSGITLQVDQRARLDFVLQVGQVSETVEVSATVPLVTSESSSIGAVVDNRKVVEMPLNSREFYSLALLVPGVAPAAQGSLLSFRGGFNVAGASELNNNFTLNGLDNNNQLLSAPAFRPSVDAIREFKILTGTYSAENGRNSGGQVLVTLKSGTNQFHGNAFEFLRNQVLDARNFFSPPNQPTPSFKRNQFGGTLGGPIVKNRTFFFLSYEGLRLSEQVAQLANVPTAEMRSGDFRSLLRLANPIRVVNPYTGQDFSTPNVIDPAMMNNIGKALMEFYPLPTTSTPAGQLPTNNYNFNSTRNDVIDQGSMRIDHTFSAKDSINGSYNDFDNRTVDPYNIVCGSRVIPGFGCFVSLKARLAGFTETHIFSPSLINEFRIGYSQFWNPREGQDSNIDFIAQYNIPGVSF
ncbi:MAG TPA: carboxypeptidase-like regulatory domain-containing protein, partial [Bryobacteraceae bacterium]|nr:carboxypeptidase-like regulatory domain-containing protein [Bryobacteraceae bacterium]